ncbi:MAG TPA: 30S ribosomal protein S2 [Elusimicrobiales bacterium]|nr:30S ribosomal protein S2 [Elusimicrobiales bacterium]HPO94805.1 30S ribosomal protein S2 [Elusimicrobiales bacterium]
MFNVTMKSMLEAGVHFGHQTYKWNPKMSKYIFGERNGIHILDLQKTLREFKKAYQFMVDAAKEGKSFLFVGTKKQAKDILKAEAERAGVYCVYEKWLGGMLTNFETIKISIRRLDELENMEEKGYFKVMSKKEVSRLTKEKNRLQKLLSGIRDMKVIPDVMFVIDPVEEHNAVSEAKRLGITVVALCDTNADPDTVDIVIPGNDDAARSVKLFCTAMADAVIEGKTSNSPAEQNISEENASEDQTAEQDEQSESNQEETTENITEENAENLQETEEVADEKVE